MGMIVRLDVVVMAGIVRIVKSIVPGMALRCARVIVTIVIARVVAVRMTIVMIVGRVRTMPVTVVAIVVMRM